jgi:hypothetical protein
MAGVWGEQGERLKITIRNVPLDRISAFETPKNVVVWDEDGENEPIQSWPPF